MLLKNRFALILVCVPLAAGQLILGPCPYPPKHVKNLDLNKFSGNWYVVAQSVHHPQKAVDCQKVSYSIAPGGKLNMNFKAYRNTLELPYQNGTLSQKNEARYPGELQLSLNNFPRRFQYRVLHVNYPESAVEYTCLSGVLNYTASVTVLHRERPVLKDLESALHRFNLTAAVPAEFKGSMRLVGHANCLD